MKFVTVTAIREFQYNGRDIQPGAVITMAALQATIYRRRQLVSASRHPGLDRHSLMPDPEQAPEPPLVPTKPKRGRRKYQRRDLVAEQP